MLRTTELGKRAGACSDVRTRVGRGRFQITKPFEFYRTRTKKCARRCGSGHVRRLHEDSCRTCCPDVSHEAFVRMMRRGRCAARLGRGPSVSRETSVLNSHFMVCLRSVMRPCADGLRRWGGGVAGGCGVVGRRAVGGLGRGGAAVGGRRCELSGARARGLQARRLRVRRGCGRAAATLGQRRYGRAAAALWGGGVGVARGGAADDLRRWSSAR